MFRIEEFPEVWTDACLRDSEGRLMFLSVYGRDGSLMQLLAAFELGSQSERGVDRIYLVGQEGERHRVDIADAKRLDKQSGRLPKQNLFGPLNQLWLFDKSLRAPDRANRIGWALNHCKTGMRTVPEAQAFNARIWQLVNLLSPVALQDHWRGPIFDWCREKRAIEAMGSDLYPTLGPVEAVRVSLTDHFVQFISDSVRYGTLTLDGQPVNQAQPALFEVEPMLQVA